MLLRISLIIAIIAGLGVAVVSQLKVADKIATITSERDDYQKKMDTAMNDAASSKKKANKLEGDLRTATKNLADTTSNLDAMTTKANQQEKRANEAAAQLENVAKERNEAQQQLAAWNALTIQPGDVKKIQDALKQTTIERDAFADEKDVILRSNKKLQARLKLYEDPTAKVEMRDGLKGKIIAVDPKWDFVVLDIGAEQGALERGELLVNRDGKLVAKLRLTTVERNRSIANVVPEWKQAQVMEGDEAFY
jgi:myosin heavy subunit